MTGSTSGSDRPPFGRARLGGLVAALVAAAMVAFAGVERVSQPLFDLYQRTAPRDLSAMRANVVWIDPESIAAVGPWPWPRYYLARLTEQIAARGAVAIGIDALFPEADRLSPEAFAALYPELDPGAAAAVRALQPHDALFAAAIGNNPVVLARAGTADPSTGPDGAAVDAASLPVEAQFAGALPPRVTAFPHAIANIPDLDEVAIGHGLVNGAPDGDGVVRRLPLVAGIAGQPTPGFALELARVAGEAETVTVTPRGVRLDDGPVVPTDAQGRMRLRFGNVPATNIHSAADVLRRGFPADAFAGRIVLVGLAAEGTQDVVPTPLRPETFGVLVQAQGVDAILRGGWLSRPGWAAAAEWGAAALLVLAILALAARRRRIALGVPGGLALLVAAGSWIAFTATLLLSPLPALAAGGAAAAGLLGVAFRDTRAERERLRETLVAERVSAAEAEGELQAARTIQIGMLPPRSRLAAIDPRLDIDALLEPAKSVGGDFYDAMRLGDDCIGFVVGDVTGKGVPASLFMAVSKALTKSIMLREPDLAGAASVLDRELARDNDAGMGVTMVIGVIDLATGAASLVNAGHENPLRIAADGTVADLRMEGGPPFCVVDGYLYPVERIRLAPGETLVLVTDGVTEAQDSAGALFGHERVAEALTGLGGEARTATEGLLATVRRFEAGSDPSDDLTVIALRYRGASSLPDFREGLGVGASKASQLRRSCRSSAPASHPPLPLPRKGRGQCQRTITSTRRFSALRTPSPVCTFSSRSPRPTALVMSALSPWRISSARISVARSIDNRSLSSSPPSVSVCPVTCTSAPGRRDTSASIACSCGPESGVRSVPPSRK